MLVKKVNFFTSLFKHFVNSANLKFLLWVWDVWKTTTKIPLPTFQENIKVKIRQVRYTNLFFYVYSYQYVNILLCFRILIMFLSSGHFTSQRNIQRHSKSEKKKLAKPWKGCMRTYTRYKQTYICFWNTERTNCQLQ